MEILDWKKKSETFHGDDRHRDVNQGPCIHPFLTLHMKLSQSNGCPKASNNYKYLGKYQCFWTFTASKYGV